jgi:hypothetical protein
MAKINYDDPAVEKRYRDRTRECTTLAACLGCGLEKCGAEPICRTHGFLVDGNLDRLHPKLRQHLMLHNARQKPKVIRDSGNRSMLSDQAPVWPI